MTRHLICRAEDVREGDMIDLEGDYYADRKGDNSEFPFELALVLGVERETLNCVRLDTDYGAFGFPAQHPIRRAAKEAAPCS